MNVLGFFWAVFQPITGSKLKAALAPCVCLVKWFWKTLQDYSSLHRPSVIHLQCHVHSVIIPWIPLLKSWVLMDSLPWSLCSPFQSPLPPGTSKSDQCELTIQTIVCRHLSAPGNLCLCSTEHTEEVFMNMSGYIALFFNGFPLQTWHVRNCFKLSAKPNSCFLSIAAAVFFWLDSSCLGPLSDPQISS